MLKNESTPEYWIEQRKKWQHQKMIKSFLNTIINFFSLVTLIALAAFLWFMCGMGLLTPILLIKQYGYYGIITIPIFAVFTTALCVYAIELTAYIFE